MPRKKVPVPYCEGYLPKGLRAAELTELCHSKPFDPDRILVFFKFLYNRTRGLNDGMINVNSFVQMHVSHLEELFSPNRVKQYVDFMVENELVEAQAAHADSKTARRFRVHPRCTFDLDLFELTAPLYTRVRVTSSRAVKANASYKQFKFEEMLNRLPTPYNALALMMRGVEVHADTDEAKAILARLRSNPKYNDPYVFDAQLEAIKNGENEYYFVCRFGGRYHSHFTSLKKELRKLLRFRGCAEPVAELDITNSQPWITSIVNEAMVRRYVPEAYDEVAAALQSTVTQAADFEAYRRLCAAGTVYERWLQVLAEQIGDDWRQHIAELDKSCGYDAEAADDNIDARSLAKILFFRVIFARQEVATGKTGRRIPLPANFQLLNDAFRAEWPSAWLFFASLKQTKLACNTSEKEGAHSNLALLMQRIESGIMREFLTKCLENGVNDIIPIYDGAVVKESDLPTAKEIFYETLAEAGTPTQPRVK